MNRPTENTVNPAITRRETRDATNPFTRVIHTGNASNLFQVLRRVRIGGTSKHVPFGSYPTLEEAIEARDTLPEDMPPQSIPVIAPRWRRENE